MSDHRICIKCSTVEGIGNQSCVSPKGHDWVKARAADCPYMERTAKGNVTPARRKRADQECVKDSRVHDSHHYGDPERRHFVIPGQQRVSV